MNITKASLELTQKISDSLEIGTFHHHYHILYDILNYFPKEINLNYLEIGCYAGGSSCLVLQRKNTNVYSVDIGYPISKEVVQRNISMHNKHNNIFEYIEGNSSDQKILETVKTLCSAVDVLFIDGDHSESGVLKDFNMYSALVKVGGFVVFDDYRDLIHSPEVKIAVDKLITNLPNYDVIGTIENTFKARPAELIEGNCFILKKNYDI